MKSKYASNNGKIFSQQKILHHQDKILNWKSGDDKTLITVEIDMTNSCNANCPGCVGGRLNNDELTIEDVKRYIDELKDIGVKAITFTGGGEPTLNKETNRAVVYARNKGFDIGFITNGLNLTDETIDTILNNCVWCRVSLNAGSPENYQRVHGLGSDKFSLAISNIKKLASKKKQIGSNCTVGVCFLTGEETKHDMLNFVKLAKDMQVDYAQLKPFNDDFTDVSNEISECKMHETEDFKVLATTYKYEHFMDEERRPYTKCHGVNFCTVITADSKVQTCCHTRGKEKYVLGDLKNKSFSDIWKDRQKIFDTIDLRECGPYLCRADEFNRLLFDLSQDKKHVNFL